MATVRDSPVRMGTVCLSCGDKGETKLLIHCRKCQDSSVHHYCMDDISPDDDNIHWVCWDCALKYKEETEILPSQSEEPVNDPTSSWSHHDVHHMSGDEVGSPSHSVSSQCATSTRSPSPQYSQQPFMPQQHLFPAPKSSPNPFQSPSPAQGPSSPNLGSTPMPAASSYPSPGGESTFSNPPSSGKVFLYPEGSGSQCGYRPSKHGSSWLAFVIKNKLDQPYKNWQDIPGQVRERWFQEWKRYVTWQPQHEIHMRKAFKSKGSHRLRDMYSEARKTHKRPIWMGEQIWEALCSHWASKGFQKKSAQAKKNRASQTGGSLHTGGCISHGTHADRMAQELGRPPTHLEVFARTHQRRADNSWVDKRSQKAAEAFQNELLIRRTQSQAGGHKETTSANTQQSEIDIWEKVVGGRNKKGRLYSMGYQQFHTSCNVPTEGKSSAGASSTPNAQARVNEFGEQIELKMERIEATQALLLQKLDQLITQTRFPPCGLSQPHSSQPPPSPP